MFGNYNSMNNMYNCQGSMQQYQNPMQSYQGVQGGQSLIRVTGIDGARAYQMQANSVVPLFDSDNDIMYIKSTDGAGFPTIKAYTFAPYDMTQPQYSNDYVTRAEFEELKGMIENGKQSIPKSAKNPDDE